MKALSQCKMATINSKQVVSIKVLPTSYIMRELAIILLVVHSVMQVKLLNNKLLTNPSSLWSIDLSILLAQAQPKIGTRKVSNSKALSNL